MTTSCSLASREHGEDIVASVAITVAVSFLINLQRQLEIYSDGHFKPPKICDQCRGKDI